MSATAVPPAGCPRCQAPLGAEARFCHRCGTRTGTGRHERAMWVAAFALSALFTVFIAMRARQMNPATAPAMANAGSQAGGAGAAAVDLSAMTPRQRFDGLFDRVMRASEAGDEAQVGQFAPMALLAFRQLDAVDQDARFHAALLHLTTGDHPAALAVADSMLARDPQHLLALLVQTTAGARGGDAALAAEARARFLAAWDTEIARSLPEYRDHRPSLNTFKQSAN